MSPKIRVSFLDKEGHSFALIELEVADDFKGNTNQAASGYIERYLASNFDEPVWEEMRQAYLAGRWEFYNVSEPTMLSTAAQSVSTAPVETKQKESKPTDFNQEDKPMEKTDLAHLVDQIRRAYAPQMEQLQNLNYRIQEKTELAEKLMQEADALTTEREQLKDSLKYFARIISPFTEDLHSLNSSILSATEVGGEDA